MRRLQREREVIAMSFVASLRSPAPRIGTLYHRQMQQLWVRAGYLPALHRLSAIAFRG
jgi:hypothetical protein